MPNTHETLSALFTDIANAIRGKTGGTTPLVADNFPAEIAGIETGGGGGATDRAVVFLDYDGTEVAEWDSSEVAGKTTLPENPIRERLVAQGWNWTLAEIKSYAADYPNVTIWVGQMYKTASGVMELDITVTPVTGLTVTCEVGGTKTWGDGTSDTENSHTYESYGDYTITCDGNLPDGSGLNYPGALGQTEKNNFATLCREVRFSGKETSFGTYALHGCKALQVVSAPTFDAVVGNVRRSGHLFENCNALTHITVSPKGGIGIYDLQSCKTLRTVSLPPGMTTIPSYVFNGCTSLTSITLPLNLIRINSYAFQGCSQLTSLSLPTGLSRISPAAFSTCVNCLLYDFQRATSVPTLEAQSAFADINAYCKIVVPDGLYDTWIIATNWAAYADYICKASEVST